MPLYRRRKLKVAVAASVAVAGCAAVVLSPVGETVATFGDDVFGGGQFNAADAEWQVESSTNGAAWAQTDTDSPATLSVSNVPLVPGRAAYTRFDLRTKAGSPLNGGTITMSAGAQQSGSTQAGSYRMRATWRNDGACNAAAFASGNNFLVGTASTYGTMLSAPTVTFPLPAPQSFSAPGPARSVCLEFSLPDTAASDALNGTSVSVRWIFAASQN